MQEMTDFVMSEWPLFLALAVILALLARAFLTGARGVGPMQAVAMMNRENAVVVDVRTDKEFEEGHISDALHIPLGLLQNRLGELQAHKNSPLIMACRSGARSAQAASQLMKQGFTNVHNLSGGMLAWSNANLPVSKGAAKRKKKPKDSNTTADTTVAQTDAQNADS